MGRVLDLRSTGRGFKSHPGKKLRNSLGQVVHTYVPCHQAVLLGTGQRAVMLCGWEGNAGLAESNGRLPPGG